MFTSRNFLGFSTSVEEMLAKLSMPMSQEEISQWIYQGPAIPAENIAYTSNISLLPVNLPVNQNSVILPTDQTYTILPITGELRQTLPVLPVDYGVSIVDPNVNIMPSIDILPEEKLTYSRGALTPQLNQKEAPPSPIYSQEGLIPQGFIPQESKGHEEIQTASFIPNISSGNTPMIIILAIGAFLILRGSKKKVRKNRPRSRKRRR